MMIFYPFFALAQKTDTSYLKSLYNRCLDFTEEKKDSLRHYAQFIAVQSEKHHFIKGAVLSLRLKGLYEELKNNYEKAIEFYLQSLEAARKINGTEYEIAALSDLAILYANLKQPVKAKEVYLESAGLSAKKGDVAQLVTVYTNLGAIYNQLNLRDSAMIYLKEGIRISRPLEEQQDLSALYNNLGNVYFKNARYNEALQLFARNRQKHAAAGSASDLWLDYLNIADVFIARKQYDSAWWYADSSLQLALSIGSKSKEADSYNILAKLFESKKDFKNAYLYKQKWYSIDTALVNRDISLSITGLEAKYKAREREHRNVLLTTAIEKEKLRTSVLTFFAVTAALVAFISAIFILQKRRANNKLVAINRQVTKQNKLLAELNCEKKSLLNVISHQLDSPLANIRMWAHVLQSNTENLIAGQRKAIERIVISTSQAEKLIHHIKDVEKADIDQHAVNLETVNIKEVVEEVVNHLMPAAQKKNVSLQFQCAHNAVLLTSDAGYVARICQHLISNALTCSPENGSVQVSLADTPNSVCLQVKDSGTGISPEEMPLLFSRYNRLTFEPTNGHRSTSPNLSDVRRLAENVNGEVFCQSHPGKGSVFCITLYK